jgi:F-type H+-transporting ATPase subunit delta
VSALAERYALAVFELGTESGQLQQLTEQLRAVSDAYAASDDLRSVLDNPLVEDARRSAIIDAVASRVGLGRLAKNTVRLLARRHRMSLLVDMSRALDRLADERAGVLRATVTSARPLSDTFCRQLTSELERSTRRKVLLERQLDPSLIGGVVTRVGDAVIDGSLKGRLADLERQLLTR